MSVALSIAFTGLCALVADGNEGPGEILLVDAQGVGAIGGISLPAHAPTLSMSLSALANPDTSHPNRVIVGAGQEQVGLWDLAGTEVRIRVQGSEATGLQLFEAARGETTWPEPPRNADDPASWRDLRFVPEMRVITGDGRIDPALLAGDPLAPGPLPASVAARIRLEAGLIAGGLPSHEANRGDQFVFRASGSEASLRQAMTDTLEWSLETGAVAVVIEIVPVTGGTPRRLLLAESAQPHRLFVSNLPSENTPHDLHAVSDEQMSALHFGVYYRMLMNEQVKWYLPELWYAPQSAKGTGFLRPMTCPPARFTRQ